MVQLNPFKNIELAPSDRLYLANSTLGLVWVYETLGSTVRGIVETDVAKRYVGVLPFDCQVVLENESGQWLITCFNKRACVEMRFPEGHPMSIKKEIAKLLQKFDASQETDCATRSICRNSAIAAESSSV